MGVTDVSYGGDWLTYIAGGVFKGIDWGKSLRLKIGTKYLTKSVL